MPPDSATPSVGLQLYTVRREAAADLPGTLRRVAALGYDGVELAGLHRVPAERVRVTCAEVGLEICGAHVPVERLEREREVVLAELETLGIASVVFPALPADDDLGRAVARLGTAAAVARAAGLRPVFHNHDHDLRRDAGGSRPWEQILALDLELELDLGWAWVAGEDPAALLAAHAGRVQLVHVKDHRADRSDCPVGDGEVGYAALVTSLLAARVHWLVVEQDEPGPQAFAACGRSLGALHAMLASRAS